jgi:hypothetical protein
VVHEQGPLTAGNLHSIAIGVATALAAIHGAGVIHRDLKPRNVLFSLGTPKVIDFGIARAFDASSQHTGTDQIFGTVAYMAPERFDSVPARPVSAAADVFAWGVVVTYAGTGRTPFAADSPASTAARILTQPPDLTGLSGPLRDVVARTLAKDPQERPSAHELLDMLLTAGHGASPIAVDLAQRPELQRAAQAARRAGRHSVDTRQQGTRRWRTRQTETRGDHTVHLSAGPGRERRRRTVAVVLGVLLVAVGAAAAPSVGRLLASPDAPGAAAFPAPASTPPTRTPAVTTAPPPSSVAPTPRPVRGTTIVDRLDRPGRWSVDRDDPTASCTFDGHLVVRTSDAATMRCPGPRDSFAGDQSVAVDLMLDTQGTCAVTWLRFTDAGGYRVSVCVDAVSFAVEDGDGGVDVIGAVASTAFQPGVKHRLGIDVRGAKATITVDGARIAAYPMNHPALDAGRVVVGATAPRADTTARALFANIEIRTA